MEIERLFTVVEAASALRVSPWTIRSWLANGRLQRRKLGSRVAITSTELQNVIDNGLKPLSPKPILSAKTRRTQASKERPA